MSVALTVASMGLQALGSIGAGEAKRTSYKIQAKQAKMDAELAEIGRRRELNDALAMQAVMFAASGTSAGSGSARAIVEADMDRAERDIQLIKAGAKGKQASFDLAGQQARTAGYSRALTSGATDLMSMYKSGAFADKKQVK